MSARILVAEDEHDLASIFVEYVAAAGYAVEAVANGKHALARVRDGAVDLLVLDILLPGMGGIAVCAAIRAFSDLPIIMVTAKVQEIDRLLGLDTGADDYLCKPVSPRELVARIRAVLRRTRAVSTERVLAIDERARTVHVHAQPLDLTRTEFDLLATMARRPGTIYTRAQLLDVASRDSLDVNERAVDTHIKNLRRKLAQLAPEHEIIHSVYGLGYRVEY